MNTNFCQNKLHIWCSLGLSNHYVCTATAFPSSKLAFHTSTLLANTVICIMTLNPISYELCINKKNCKERLQWTHSKFKHFHSIVPRKSLTFMRAIPSMFPVPAKERILYKLGSACLEQPGLRERVDSARLHQSHSQLWLREAQILTIFCPLFQLLACRHCCTPQE